MYAVMPLYLRLLGIAGKCMTSDIDVENYKRSPKPVCLPHLITLRYYSLLRFFAQKLATTSSSLQLCPKHTHIQPFHGPFLGPPG